MAAAAQACDVEFKDELTQRICSVVEKYATDKEWHIDTIIQTLLVSTAFTSEETVCSMIALVTSNPDLQAYATHKLYMQLAEKTMQPVLLQLGVWCVGEYGELLIAGVPAGIDTEEYTAPDPVSRARRSQPIHSSFTPRARGRPAGAAAARCSPPTRTACPRPPPRSQTARRTARAPVDR